MSVSLHSYQGYSGYQGSSSNSSPQSSREGSSSMSADKTETSETYAERRDSAPLYNTQESQPYRGLEAESYTESIIDPADWAKDLVSHPGQKAKHYVRSLFPILGWITHYPFMPAWIYSDFIAGLTVAIVLVPQGMSYAQLATLSPEYGLYSSFIGLLMYSFFATSKDVSIGPVAVMSLEVGKIVVRVQEKFGDTYSAVDIGTTLALICGAITLGIGLLRLGFLVELIPLPAVLAFMAGSAFNIMCGQVAGLMGFNKRVNSRDATYMVVINTLKNLKHTKVDAAFGLVCLFILYFWKWAAQRLYKRYPRNKVFFYLQHIRAAIVIIFATVISWAIVRKLPDGQKPAFSITGEIKSGLRDVRRFVPPAGLPADIASELPVATVILVLEHIAIAKSFGRINDYKINPNQEFIAIGVTNMIATFFHAYPATGSFSRTALKSKCGVRTPFAGVFGGACVLLAIYCFTDAFYYIPKAALSAIIIHAVSDLIPAYTITWNLYKVQPLDCGIFLIGLIITVFSAIENGIYFAVAAAAAVVLWRLCITNGAFLGRVRVAETLNPALSENPAGNGGDLVYHYRWVPLPDRSINPSSTHTRYINSQVTVEAPPPGVIVYRLSESFIYPNCSRQVDNILDEVKKSFRDFRSNRDPTFNNPGPLIVKNPFKEISTYFKNKRAGISTDSNVVHYDPNDKRPILRVVHLDFSQVVSIDTTSIQALIDLKKAITMSAGPDFEIHFSGIINPWVIRGLVNGGFGGKDPEVKNEKDTEANAEAAAADAAAAESEDNDSPDTDEPLSLISTRNKAQGDATKSRYVDVGIENGELKALFDNRHPHFHFDIPSYSEFEV